MIWGVSSALHEATEVDRRSARYYNTDLAEYLVPVNADIGEAEVILIPEEDHLVNDLGIKGLGDWQRRHQRGGRQRRLPRDRRKDPRSADPAGKTARRAVDRLLTDIDRTRVTRALALAAR